MSGRDLRGRSLVADIVEEEEAMGISFLRDKKRKSAWKREKLDAAKIDYKNKIRGNVVVGCFVR